ncbi:MAG: hypothetical protein GY797_08785 [Deltaproteobacteria bacterium]|nr:hypothetical protein [Deltaproteobacteria bacterium]
MSLENFATAIVLIRNAVNVIDDLQVCVSNEYVGYRLSSKKAELRDISVKLRSVTLLPAGRACKRCSGSGIEP